MAVTRIWDADNSTWRLVGGDVAADPNPGLYLPLAGGTMTGPLVLATNPTVDAQAATKAYVDSVAGGGGGLIPTGIIIAFGGATPPTGFLLCDGSVISRTTYATLFGVIGIAYGAGDGSTTFKLPDLRQRFPMGKAASGTGSTLGGTGGTIDHQHSGPSHSHSQVAHVHDLGNSESSGAASPGTNSVGAHGHDIPSGTTTTSDSHSHTFSDTGSDTSSGPSFTQTVPSSGTGAVSVGGSTHTHSVSVAVSGSTSSDSHNHGIGGISTNTVGNHSHNILAHVHDLGSAPSGGATTTGASGTGDTTGGGTNPPFQTVNYIIKT